MIHIPLSTYRLQFNNKFGFNSAASIVPYLASLGITDIYASPILKAKKGSMHGYDIVDPDLLNPELGSEEDYNLLVKEFQKFKLCWLQDIVPNHMAYNAENLMLIDLLENGINSRYYNYFDIDWHHPYSRIRDRVLAPFLGKYYQEALEDGEIKLNYDKDGFSLNYYETRLPLKMESYLDVLSYRLDKLRNRLGRNDADFIKFQGILYVLKSLPSAEELDERYYQIKFVKSLLWEIYSTKPEIKVFIDENIKAFNGTPGNKDSFNFLDKLHSEQHYRLSFWKVANEEINYSRFFDINELISVKVENEETFSRTHSFILKLVKEGKINGLRIDHVDGLYDPTQYLKTLRERGKNTYIVVEKILQLNEEIPKDWPVEGTTGYEFLNYLNGIFCKAESGKKLSTIYQNFIKREIFYEDLVRDKKRLFVQTRMAGEVERLAFMIEAISNKDRYGIDITLLGLKKALEEILIYFPIYRTYISKKNFYKRDKEYLSEVLEWVNQKHPILMHEFNYIGSLLFLKFEERFTVEDKDKIYDFVMRFQQLTGPLMAKGFEDTTLYIYNRFISLNEVGGEPGKFGITLKEFHQFNKKKKKQLPYSLNASSTHDTKRGEDVRAFLNVLSEISEEWNDKIKYWNKINRSFKKNINPATAGLNSPDRNDEYFLYQTLIGSYPLEVSPDPSASLALGGQAGGPIGITKEKKEEYLNRIKEYLIKASREAKVYSSWVKPNNEYEAAYTSFAEKILEPSDQNKFLEDFIPFQKKIAHYGMFNSLSQTLIKISAPGVPDFYQGSELWNLSLVDPDNRRPVDYKLRENFLKEIDDLNPNNIKNYLNTILANKEDGRIKIFLIKQALFVRNNYHDLFTDGEYIPLEAEGQYKRNIIAFARKHKNDWSITIAPRFLTGLIKEYEAPIGKEIWEDTYIKLPVDKITFTDQITKEELIVENNLKISDALKLFPAAFLIGKEEEQG